MEGTASVATFDCMGKAFAKASLDLQQQPKAQ